MRDNSQNTQNRQPTVTERLRALALYCRRTDLPEDERALFAADLEERLKTHGLTQEDLEERDAEFRRFSPPPLTAGERGLAACLAGRVRWPFPTDLRRTGDFLEAGASPEQWERIGALWSHHLPRFRRNWEAFVAPEEERPRAEGESGARGEPDPLPGRAVSAYMGLARVSPLVDWFHGTAEEPGSPFLDRLWSPATAELAARMTVEPWRNPAGPSTVPAA